MAKGRYSETDVLDGNRYGTFTIPVKARGMKDSDLLEGVKTIEHVLKRGERLDHLAAKYYNEDSYWWIIALVNSIRYPIGISPGTVLRIPVEARDIFEKIFR